MDFYLHRVVVTKQILTNHKSAQSEFSLIHNELDLIKKSTVSTSTYLYNLNFLVFRVTLKRVCSTKMSIFSMRHIFEVHFLAWLPRLSETTATPEDKCAPR